MLCDGGAWENKNAGNHFFLCFLAEEAEYVLKKEMKEQVEMLLQKKNELWVRLSGQRDIEHYVKPQPKVIASYASTISATRLGDNEVMVQITLSEIRNFLIL
ncbi:unnamed protein product [Brassica oleracea var. botrytis]|uniref:Uncharacterized protein n=2 Tax=Brassica oleracea TaxID=3712 RepID=A0A0D3CU79_BRAOL|nr:unnamed protein product [Brassica oleracea]